MQQGAIVDRSKTAIIIMDYQKEIIAALPAEKQKLLLRNAKGVMEAGRKAGIEVMYAVVRFRPGYPEISPRNKAFTELMQREKLKEGTEGVEIHPEVKPRPDEIVVINRRAGSFSTTDLQTILRAKEIDTLVLLGIITGGVVLSTVRLAADMDYRMVVISDGCTDPDDEVHRILTEKVFPRQATVLTAQEFINALSAR